MKHLKPYRLFESQEVLLAGIENAIENNNIQLIKDMIEQSGLDPSMNDNFALEFATSKLNEEMVKYLAYLPQVQAKFDLAETSILQKYNFISGIIEKIEKYDVGDELDVRREDMVLDNMDGYSVLVVITKNTVVVDDLENDDGNLYETSYYKLSFDVIIEILKHVEEYTED